MNRRFFVLSGMATGALITFAELAIGAPAAKPKKSAPKQPVTPNPEVCITRLDEITAEATGYTRYEHHHQLSIPVSVLIHPPEDGFKVRTSTLDQGSLDEEAFKAFIKESGLSDSLRFHSHEVFFSKDDLNRIASGEKEVKISVLSPKGNPAHDFFFTAPRSAIIKVKRGRANG